MLRRRSFIALLLLSAAASAQEVRDQARQLDQNSTKVQSHAALNQTTPWFVDFLPQNAFAVVNISLEGLAKHPASRPLYELIKSNRGFRQTYGVSAAEIRDIAAVHYDSGEIGTRIIVRTRSPVTNSRLTEEGWVKFEPRFHLGKPYWVSKSNAYFWVSKSNAYFFPDAQTFVIDTEEKLKQYIERPRGRGGELPAWLCGITRVSGREITGAIDASALSAFARKDAATERELLVVKPLLQDVKTIFASIVSHDRLTAEIVVESRDTNSAEQIEFVAKNWEHDWRNNTAKKTSGESLMAEFFGSLLPIFHSILKEVELKRVQETVEFRLSGPFDVVNCREIVAAIQQKIRDATIKSSRVSSDDVRKFESAIKLDALNMGMFKYYRRFGHFPPPIIYAPSSASPHSWRVAILPYIDELDLYQQYNLNEPWDSPNNSKLLMQAPESFRAPDEKPDSPNTSYFVFTGKDTIFAGAKGTTVAEITDGMDATLIMVESKRNVPWTKPEDIPFDPAEPLPELGGVHRDAFSAIMANGMLRGFPNTFSSEQIKALITKAGGDSQPPKLRPKSP